MITQINTTQIQIIHICSEAHRLLPQEERLVFQIMHPLKMEAMESFEGLLFEAGY